jgi:hypothetical protein
MLSLIMKTFDHDLKVHFCAMKLLYTSALLGTVFQRKTQHTYVQTTPARMK